MLFPLAALILLAASAAMADEGNLPILLGYAGARPGKIIEQSI